MNAARGEAIVAGVVLRPSFENLVSAEDELGSLFALVERAATGELRLAEMVALFWHCRADRNSSDRVAFAESVTAVGLARATPALKALLQAILSGR